MYWVTTGVARIMAASGTTRDVGLIECPFRLARRRRLLMDFHESDTSLVPTFCGRDPTAPSRPATQGREPAPLSIATDANRQELASESL